MNKKLTKAILAGATSVMIVAPQVAGAVEVVSANKSTVSTKALARVDRSISISRADVHKHTNKASAVKVQGKGLTIYAYFQSDDGKEVTLFAEKPDGDNYVKRFANSGTTDINFGDGKTAIHRVKVNISGQIPQPIENVRVTMNEVLKENASDKGEVIYTNDALYKKGSTQTIKPSGHVFAGYTLQGGSQTIKVNGDKTVTFVYMKDSKAGNYVPLNLDTLRSTLASADNLKESDYIASTWEAMTKVRTASRKPLLDGVTQNDKESGSMTQATINTANTNLQNAIKNLVKPVAPVRLNVATLQASVTKFDNLNEAIYTPASWKPLGVSGATGKTVLAKAISQNSSSAQASPNDLTQAQVNTASANIEANIKKLVLAEVFIPIKTDELVKALAVANKLNRELYTANSYSDLQDTMIAGSDVIALASDINDEETMGTDTQAKVDQAKADIEKALTQVEALIKLNTTGITKALETSDLFNEADYTPESWSVFAEAKENAKQAEIRATAQNDQQQPQTMTQAQLNTATTSLTNAQKGLVANGTVNDLDTSALEAELVVAESIENDGYTVSSWSAFVSQIDYAKGILQLAETSSTLTQSDIDFAVTLLQLAQEDLTKEEVAPLDYAVLQSDVNKANSIKDIGYTERSWGNFTEARTVANEVLKDAMSTNPTVTQEDINRAEMNLSIAKNNLKLEPIVLDATQLSKAVNDAKKLNEGEYTKASWSAFATAFVEAESQVYFASQGTTTQVNIDNSLKSLNTAVKNLVKVDIPAPSLPLQLTGFKTAVTKANAIKNDGYTNATWTVFNNARNASKDLLVRAEAQNNSRALITQAQIDNSVKTLDNATKNLKKEVKVDFSALKATVTNANKLTSNGYTTASFNSFAKVRTASTKVLNNTKLTQAQVNKANTDLVNAQKALVKVANFNTLKSTVTKANKVHAKGYTKASWKTFSTVRNTANKVLKNNNATQAQVNKANTDLVKAQKSLKKEAVKVNKNTLKATVTKANKVKAKGYTKASFNSFAKVRTASTKVLNNAKATQAQVNKANTDLVKAQKSLKKVAVKINKTALKSDVTSAKKVKAKGYTKASFNKFNKTRKASEKVLNNKKATQAQVNKATNDLKKAKKSLKKSEVKNDNAVTPVAPNKPVTPNKEVAPNKEVTPTKEVAKDEKQTPTKEVAKDEKQTPTKEVKNSTKAVTTKEVKKDDTVKPTTLQKTGEAKTNNLGLYGALMALLASVGLFTRKKKA